MSNRSVIVLSKCTKTSQEINQFFGSKNVLSIKNALKSKKNSSLKKKTDVEKNSFLNLFSPKVQEYSARSILVTPTKNKSKVKSHLVVEEEPFVKPLYWNKSLGGWISSKDNKKFFSLKSSKKTTAKKTTSKKTKAKNNSDTFMELFKPTAEVYSDRSFLVKPTKNKLKVKSHLVVEEKPFVKPLYWNKTLGGWVTSRDNAHCFDESQADSGSDSSSEFQTFMKYFKPKVESYSERSLVLRPTKNKSKATEWPCVEDAPLKKPLYWNKTVGGWVTSKDNSDCLGVDTKKKINVDYSYLTSISQKEKKALENYVLQKYKRGLLLKSNKKQKSPKKYFHKGYWNETLQGWVFSKKEMKSLVSKGAVMV